MNDITRAASHHILMSELERNKKMSEEYITLKWGTLKSWNITSEEGRALLKRYGELGCSISAMGQKDTPEQKEIICKLIDIVPSRPYLDWDGKYVTKAKAKKYVMEYDASRS